MKETMIDEKNFTCPFCESKDFLEASNIVGTDYSENEYMIYTCLDCGREFDEQEME